MRIARRVRCISEAIRKLRRSNDGNGRRIYHGNEYGMCLIAASLTANPELARICVEYLYKRS